MWNPEIKTDTPEKLTFERERLDGTKTYTGDKALEFWSGQFNTCNDFAWAYAEANENVTVKVSEVEQTIHCYVYDAEKDLTIDATLGQFDDLAVAGVWDGDVHPHVDASWMQEFESKAEFVDEYDGDNSPFIL